MSQSEKVYVTTRLISHVVREINEQLNQLALESAGIAPTNSRMLRRIRTTWPNESLDQSISRAQDSQYQIALRQIFQLLWQMKYSVQEYTDTLQTLRRNEHGIQDPEQGE